MMRARELRHFLLLDRLQQAQAIHRLTAAGMSHSTIAAATGLSAEAVRALLADRGSPSATEDPPFAGCPRAGTFLDRMNDSEESR